MQGEADNRKTRYPRGSQQHKPLSMGWQVRRGSKDSSKASPAVKGYLKGSDGSHSSRSSSERNLFQNYQSTKSGESSRSVNSSRQSDGSDRHSVTTASSASSIQASKATAARGSLQHSVDKTSTRSQDEKSVRFKEIQIRDYERIVGDNPSCSSGPPIGLGWCHGDTRILGVDAYENSRPQRHRSVRIAILTREEREQILMSWGVSFNEIIDSIRANIKVKNQRRQTVTNLGKVERIEEAFESATRKLKRALLLRKRTGDKVKQLKERSELASHTLASLKIAEDRALSEIHADAATVEHEPERDNPKNLEAQVSVSDFFKKTPAESLIQRSVSNLSDDDGASGVSAFTLGNSTIGNSTTASMREVEMFYRELELELFGDAELPSMVGQTLEVPRVDIPKETRYVADPPSVKGYRVDDGSSPSPKPNSCHYQFQDGNGFVTAIQNTSSPTDEPRSFLTRSLERQQHFMSPPDHAFVTRDPPPLGPLHMHRYNYYPGSHPPVWYNHDVIPQVPYHPSVRLSSSLDSCDMSSHYARGAVAAVEQQYLQQFHAQPPPSSTPRTGSRQPYPVGSTNERMHPSSPRRNKYSSSPHAGADGPLIRHVPPPTNLTPTHWMEDYDSPKIRILEEPMTITEDSYEQSSTVYGGTQPQKYDPTRQPFPYSQEPL